MADSRASLSTERDNPRSRELDLLSIAQAFDVMQAEDASVADAIERARPEIVRAIELVARRLAEGGRLFYVGAGTSGRLGVLDSVECPPTFQTEPEKVQAILAGGLDALTRAIEGAEDDRELARRAIDERAIDARDIVLGIAASGTTPFVHAALARAKERGAATVFLACVPREEAADAADLSIRVVTGPEVIAGSTRLKAGTATKLVLNRISTLAMVQLGKVHGNWMVDVNTRGNQKLWRRGVELVARLAGVTSTAAEELLRRADGQVKVAVVMQRHAIGCDAARERLARASGVLRRALE